MSAGRCASIREVPAPDAARQTLVAEATRRAGVLWLSSPVLAPALVWHLWHAGAAYVVCGGGEQSLPDPGPTALVVVRGASGARVVQWAATVTAVEPGSALWDEVTPLLAAARLNAPSAQGLPERWAQTSTVLRLAPAHPGPHFGPHPG